MNPHSRLRVFLDSNVILAGFLSPWGLDKAILSLGAACIVTPHEFFTELARALSLL